MKNQKEKNSFSFTYSAKEQEEVRQIRQKYQPQEEDKMEQLRRLDANVTRKATAVSIAIGVIGALVMGSGMSIIMTNVGEQLGLQGTVGTILGIVFGIIGIILVALAYPLYNGTLKREREKIAPEIIRLTDELIK